MPKKFTLQERIASARTRGLPVPPENPMPPVETPKIAPKPQALTSAQQKQLDVALATPFLSGEHYSGFETAIGRHLKALNDLEKASQASELGAIQQVIVETSGALLTCGLGIHEFAMGGSYQTNTEPLVDVGADPLNRALAFQAAVTFEKFKAEDRARAAKANLQQFRELTIELKQQPPDWSRYMTKDAMAALLGIHVKKLNELIETKVYTVDSPSNKSHRIDLNTVPQQLRNSFRLP